MSFEYSDNETSEQHQTSGTASKGNGESPSLMHKETDGSHFRTVDSFRNISSQVKDRVKAMFSQQMNRTAEELNSFAYAFRQTGEKLRDQNQDTVAAYANRIADGVERFSGNLRHNDIESVFEKAKELAREKPLVFMGGAFTLGVFFAHFLRGSGSENFHAPAPEPEQFYDEEVISYERH